MITGMCGDGGNDCAALRAATFGFALSETDAGE
jgi:P-type E1-E2 ATPase